MAKLIDVKTLGKKEIILLVKDLLDNKIITHQLLTEVAEMADATGDDTETWQILKL